MTERGYDGIPSKGTGGGQDSFKSKTNIWLIVGLVSVAAIIFSLVITHFLIKSSTPLHMEMLEKRLKALEAKSN